MSIRDIGYRPYDGPREPHRRRYLVLVTQALARAWGVRMVKLTLLGALFPMVVFGAVMVIKLKAIQIAGEHGGGMLRIQGAPGDLLEDPAELVFSCFFWSQLWFSLALSLRVAAPAVAEDIRTGAFQFYFSRPVSRVHYLVGKVGPTALLVAMISAGPALLLSGLRLVLAQSGAEAAQHLWLVPRVLLAAPVFALFFSLVPAALGSLTRRSGTAQGLWAAIFFLSWIVGDGLAEATGIAELVLISLPSDLIMVGQHIFGHEPLRSLHWIYPSSVLLGVYVLCAAGLRRRLGRRESFA